MISDTLGLSINQKVLNKKSPSSVVSTLEKTATNYIAIGRMAEDLKLIRLNFSRWIAGQGVKVRGTPDMHMLKEDELSRKFNVQREKYSQSKITRAGGDTGDKKGLGRKLLEYYLERKVERKIAARVLKVGKKFTTVRKFIRLKKKLLVIVNKLIDKINIKKMFMNWVKKNYKKFLKPFINMFSNALKRFVKKGLQKLVIRFSTAFLAAVGFSGPFAVFIAGAITIGLMVWDPLMAAIDEFKKGGEGNPFKVFLVKLIDEFTLGIFGEENIEDFGMSISKWFDSVFFSALDSIDKSIKFIEEKVTSFGNFIIKKFSSMLVTKENQSDFISAFDAANEKRLKEDAEFYEKYGKWFEQMDEAIANKKVKIRQLEIEIAQLEYDLKTLVQGPENARLEEAKIEKAKEEKQVAVLEKEQTERQVGDAPEPEKKISKKEKSAPIPPKTEPKKEPTPAPPPKKPEVAAMRTDQVGAAKTATPTPSSGKFEHAKQMLYAYEGWKNQPYLDSRKLWTIGVGHLIGDGKKLPFKDKDGTTYTKDTYLSNAQVRDLFEKDFEAHLKLAEKTPGWDQANDAGKTAMIDLTYNMGGWWYTKFKKAAGYLKEGNFKDAAKELQSSAWYKQVGERAKLTVSLMTSGASNDKSGSEALASVMSSQKVASGGKYLTDESIQLAQAQREQTKPKGADVVNVAQINNNKKTQQQNLAMNKPGPDAGSTMSDRAAA